MLARDHQVVRGPAAGAAAVIVAGDRLPPDAAAIDVPAFVVLPGAAAPAVVITRVDAPARAQFDARVPFGVTVETTGAAGRTLDATLRRGGVVLDRVSREVPADAVAIDLELSFVSANVGLAPVTVDVRLPGAAAVRADVAVDVRRDPWRVLFFDGRPSWSSTFVRRTLQRDPRFDVSHRTRTSTGVGTGTAGVPASLAALAPLADFQVIVVSAPEALPARDRAGLDAFARRRGGAVLLLLDDDPGSTLAALTGVERWQFVALPAPDPIALFPASAEPIRAAELIVPAALPPRARVLGRATAERRPVLFDAPAGAGRVLVSGLADAWRYRGAQDDSAFAAMWPRLIGAAAAAAPPPIDIAVSPSAAAPGEAVNVTVAVRDVLLSDGPVRQATLAAALDTGSGTVPVRLWPDGPPGLFRGSFRAPVPPGTARLRVRAGDQEAVAALAIVDHARQPLPDQIDLLGWWASTRGGRLWAEGKMEALRAAVTEAVPAERARVRRHVMRSPWWIVPFALALGFEWRSRRRQGRR
jgi:hypothetical protein